MCVRARVCVCVCVCVCVRVCVCACVCVCLSYSAVGYLAIAQMTMTGIARPPPLNPLQKHGTTRERRKDREAARAGGQRQGESESARKGKRRDSISQNYTHQHTSRLPKTEQGTQTVCKTHTRGSHLLDLPLLTLAAPLPCPQPAACQRHNVLPHQQASHSKRRA